MKAKFITGACNNRDDAKLVVLKGTELYVSDYADSDSDKLFELFNYIPAVTVTLFIVKFVERFPHIFGQEYADRLVKALKG